MKFLYRWLIATLAGAATIFVWEGISHMVLLKGSGFTSMSNEERIVSTLRTSLPGDGLYFFPSIESQREPNRRREGRLGSEISGGPYRSGLSTMQQVTLRYRFPVR